MKRNNNPQTNNDQAGKTGKAQSRVQRDAKEVMAGLVATLSEKLEPRPEKAGKAGGLQDGVPGPNRARLTVGVDLGDKSSNYCILGLDGEKLSEGQLATTQAAFSEFFQLLAAARVVMEAGTHSAWAHNVVAGLRRHPVFSCSRS